MTFTIRVYPFTTNLTDYENSSSVSASGVDPDGAGALLAPSVSDASMMDQHLRTRRQNGNL